MCDVAGVTDSCIYAENSFNSSFGCGILDDTEFSYKIYKGCYSTGGSNTNDGDIPADPSSTCSESSTLQTLYDTLFMCLAGDNSGITHPWLGIPFNYDVFKCEMNEPVCEDLNNLINYALYSEPWTYSVNDYIRWSYGCGCAAANAIYESADADTKEILEEMAGEDGSFVRNLAAFSGQDGVEWAQNLGCNIDSVSCDVTTGDIAITPSQCAPGMFRFFGDQCAAFCGAGNAVLELIWEPAQGLTFEQIAAACPNVEKLNKYIKYI